MNKKDVLELKRRLKKNTAHLPECVAAMWTLMALRSQKLRKHS